MSDGMYSVNDIPSVLHVSHLLFSLLWSPYYCLVNDTHYEGTPYVMLPILLLRCFSSCSSQVKIFSSEPLNRHRLLPSGRHSDVGTVRTDRRHCIAKCGTRAFRQETEYKAGASTPSPNLICCSFWFIAVVSRFCVSLSRLYQTLLLL